ncbi:recombinase family protein [Vagococcus carniphilus]|uniref:recombinase family protein n=1 Tax=Vagococcus carniphilus TaxID=218144 RepID=UPI003BA93F8E
MDKKIRVAIYIRVSTEQQAKFGDSLREQKETLENYVKNRKDMELISTYIDDGISGQKLQRDEFQRLLSDVESNQIDMILFTKLDRWFRNLRHYLNTQEILEKHNVAWKAVTQEFYDTSTPIGRTIIAQMMSFGELEAQMTSDRIKAVFENKTKKGEVTSGKVPLGYSIKDKKLVINDDAEMVKDLFNFYLSNGTMRQTVYYLEDRYKIKRDYQSVKSMLTNKKYIGEHKGNLNYCPSIIDKEIFEEVQNRLSNNVKHNTHRTFIFSGLVKCSVCDASFSGNTRRYKKKKPNADGIFEVTESKNYRCSKHRANINSCFNKKIVTEKNLEKYLLENLKNEMFETEAKRNLNKKRTPSVDNTKSITRKLVRLKDAYLNEVITLEEYKKDKLSLDAQLDKQIKENESVKINKFTSADIDWNFLKNYSDLTESDKRELWRMIIKKITVDDKGNLTIFFI